MLTCLHPPAKNPPRGPICQESYCSFQVYCAWVASLPGKVRMNNLAHHPLLGHARLSPPLFVHQQAERGEEAGMHQEGVVSETVVTNLP